MTSRNFEGFPLNSMVFAKPTNVKVKNKVIIKDFMMMRRTSTAVPLSTSKGIIFALNRNERTKIPDRTPVCQIQL